jgi:hypothetical protein
LIWSAGNYRCCGTVATRTELVAAGPVNVAGPLVIA